MLPANQVLPTDTVLPNDLRPCRLAVRDNGIFTFELTEGPTNFSIYDRGDPRKNEEALREALPAPDPVVPSESFRPLKPENRDRRYCP